MVAMRMGNQSPIHRLPRVDIEVPGAAIETALGGCDERGRHIEL
jgi:hypothetical protein